MAVKNSAAEVQMLKDRIQNLEKEVADYKRRLADLRKAKNQTILKREREIVEVKTPFQRRSSDIGPQRNSRDEAAPRDNHVQRESDSSVKALEEEISRLKLALEERMEDSRQETSTCGHEEQLQQMEILLEGMESERNAFKLESDQLRARVDLLTVELSRKEAAWCERENQLTRELSRSFGEKYQAWMRETEAKLSSLQDANAQLRVLLEAHRPKGPDPTGQDKY